jgi:DNA-directed RNA polymerase alpha subunit
MTLRQDSKPLSADFLLSRQECCGNKCANCPYMPPHIWGNRVHFHVPIQVLNQYGLSVKLVNALEKAGYKYILDMRSFTASTTVANVGSTSKTHIANALKAFLNDSPHYFGKDN